MSAHTPGPWRIVDELDGNLWIDSDGNAGVAKVEPQDRMDGKGERITDEDYANARLIAASPEMLAFLLKVEAELPSLEWTGLHCCPFCEARDLPRQDGEVRLEAVLAGCELRKLIAKAGGRKEDR